MGDYLEGRFGAPLFFTIFLHLPSIIYIVYNTIKTKKYFMFFLEISA